MFEHNLEEGDELASERRETTLTVKAVRDTVVDFGDDVGEWSHAKVARGLETGRLTVVNGETEA